jgi:uncharacterized protein YyaL (SSP411 family)
MINTTLTAMFRGGIYDHIGGGFSRYSTDRMWLTPHFEKMLYDNAALALTYFEAYQLTKNELFKNIGKDILNYILREMTSESGAFYSSQYAYSEGEEGKYYVWKDKELKNILSKSEYAKLKSIYLFDELGNFEHKTNIINLIKSKKENLAFSKDLQKIKTKLYQHRVKRIHPLKDTKVLTSWNGLMVSAMSLGYQVTQDDKYLKAAENSIRFIQKNLIKSNKLFHRYIDGETIIDANRNDYAYLIEGLLNLYESNFNEEFFILARNLQSLQNKLWKQSAHGFEFAPKSIDKLETSIEFSDNARPNSNAVSALNLL